MSDICPFIIIFEAFPSVPGEYLFFSGVGDAIVCFACAYVCSRFNSASQLSPVKKHSKRTVETEKEAKPKHREYHTLAKHAVLEINWVKILRHAVKMKDALANLHIYFKLETLLSTITGERKPKKQLQCIEINNFEQR
jgi:hypothetical protein